MDKIKDFFFEIKRLRLMNMDFYKWKTKDISKLEENLGINIPYSYKCYLQIIGSGFFDSPTIYFENFTSINDFVDAKSDAYENILENGNKFLLEDMYFIFMINDYNGSYVFFDTNNNNPDPPVLLFNPLSYRIQMINDTFTSFFLKRLLYRTNKGEIIDEVWT